MHRPLLVTLALPVLLGAAAQPEGGINLPSFELQRDDRTITVQQTARDGEGGISITRGGDCREEQDISFYYAPDPKRLDTRVNNTRIRSNVVLRSQPKEGGAEAQDRAVLDFFGGSLELNDETGCPRNVKRKARQQVVITEGRTTVNGSSLVYQNATGVGDMAGPVELSRRASGDSPALSASSSRLSFNVDDDIQTLRGNVQVESEGRTSEADVLELDEEAGFAVLRGNPARSRDEDGEVAGQIIEYDLDSNDVVVRQGVEATFEIDVGDEGESETALPGFGGSEDNPTADDQTTDPAESEETLPEEPAEAEGSGNL